MVRLGTAGVQGRRASRLTGALVPFVLRADDGANHKGRPPMLAAAIAFLRSILGWGAPAPEPAPPPAPKRSYIDDVDPEAIALGELVIAHADRRLAWIHGQPLPDLPAPLPAEIEVWLATKDRDGLLAVCSCPPCQLGPHVRMPAGVKGPCEARVGPVRRLAPPAPKPRVMRGEDVDGRQGRSGKCGPGRQTPHEAFMEELRESLMPSGPRMR